MGRTEASTQDYDKAIELSTESLENDAANIRDYRRRALAYYRKGYYDRALSELRISTVVGLAYEFQVVPGWIPTHRSAQ